MAALLGIIDKGWPPDSFKRKSVSGSSSYTPSAETSNCKHDYEFKYKKEKITEEGKIIMKEYYFCRHCLEEKVEEKPAG